MPDLRAPQCAKQSYPNQAAAREALAKIREKADTKKLTANQPVRVYPCDRCLGWHTTSKRVTRKPAWDRNPAWERSPSEVARIEELMRNSQKPEG